MSYTRLNGMRSARYPLQGHNHRKSGMGCGCGPIAGLSGLGCGSNSNCSCRGAVNGLGQTPTAPSWFGDTTSFAKGAAVAGTAGVLLGLLSGWAMFHKG